MLSSREPDTITMSPALGEFQDDLHLVGRKEIPQQLD